MNLTKAERDERRRAQERRAVELYLRGLPIDDLYAELERRGIEVRSWRQCASIPDACRTLRKLALERPERGASFEAVAADLEADLVARCRLPKEPDAAPQPEPGAPS